MICEMNRPPDIEEGKRWREEGCEQRSGEGRGQERERGRNREGRGEEREGKNGRAREEKGWWKKNPRKNALLGTSPESRDVIAIGRERHLRNYCTPQRTLKEINFCLTFVQTARFFIRSDWECVRGKGSCPMTNAKCVHRY